MEPAVAAALEALITLDNPDVLKPAKAAFQYKPSKVDQKWAAAEALATGFEGDAEEIERLLHERRALIDPMLEPAPQKPADSSTTEDTLHSRFGSAASARSGSGRATSGNPQ